ncbi:uncharacterized protein VTP21DRAFT_9617 [Calcarisporiella thermophila]|uniref:uncharacterized protein n=1 Tax=Calcarisporiella thermophila TaxID=911321 RepID=UPI003742F138
MTAAPRLCSEIILEDFGPIVEKVSNVLTNKGRLPLPVIQLFTKLPRKEVRESLVILMQHNLVYYAEVQEGPNLVTYYEADPIQILLRLRFPAILYYTREWFGAEGYTIVQYLMRNGKMTLNEIKSELQNQKGGTTKRRQPKDAHKNTIKVFTTMVLERYLIAVQHEDMVAKKDREMEQERKDLEKVSAMPTAAELKSLKQMRDARAEAEYNNNAIVGMKRKLDGVNGGPNKKRNQTATEEEVEENIYFRINYEKFNARFRSQEVIGYAEERINRSAAAILSSILKQDEAKLKSIREERSSSVTPSQISLNIPPELDAQLAEDIVLDQTKQPSKQDLVNEYVELLMTDRAKFLRKDDAGRYYVNFTNIGTHMKRRILETVVQEKFGATGCRLLRILLEKGKLEEKHLAKIGLLHINTARTQLNAMAKAGLVELQEVPKAPDRAPSRNFYLWDCNLDKCYGALLADLYKTLGNLRQRRREEMTAHRRLLDKSHRTEMEGEEFGIRLSATEEQELAELGRIMERLEASEMRVDKMVMVLRDFS